MQTEIIEALAIETPLYEKVTEDGIGHFYSFHIIAVTADGQEYTLSGQVFEDREIANRVADKINRAKVIDLSLWNPGTCWDGYRDMWSPEEEKEHAFLNGYA